LKHLTGESNSKMQGPNVRINAELITLTDKQQTCRKGGTVDPTCLEGVTDGETLPEFVTKVSKSD
jgi:hypothetical protein